MTVLANGSVDVDSVSRPHETGQPGIERLIENDFPELQIDQPDFPGIEAGRRCSAMAQQRGDCGYQSAPQKFVHLVGCRDTSVCPESADRPALPKR